MKVKKKEDLSLEGMIGYVSALEDVFNRIKDIEVLAKVKIPNPKSMKDEDRYTGLQPVIRLVDLRTILLELNLVE